MDSSVHGGPVRRRTNRETETEGQKLKREKAAERQRRKRERDRRNAAVLQQQQQQQQQAQAAAVASGQLQQQPPAAPVIGQGQQTSAQPSSQPPQQEQFPQELSPEDMARREKVRLAARDRQRKHRALVKQRRLRELGLDMGNDIMPGMEEPHYRAPDGQYQVLHPELQQLAPPPPPPISHEPPFPQGAPLGGQTFASTLLLSFSCAPLLKQHLLKTLGMSNEELVSLEPLIAEAWDRWDHQRRLHFADVAKNNGQPPPLPPPYAVDLNQHDAYPPPGGPFPHASGSGDPTQQTQASQAAAAANDFRARFHRSIAAPTPFQTANSTPASTGTTSAPTEGTIDPHLATSTSTNRTSSPQSTIVTANGTNKNS